MALSRVEPSLAHTYHTAGRSLEHRIRTDSLGSNAHCEHDHHPAAHLYVLQDHVNNTHERIVSYGPTLAVFGDVLTGGHELG